MSTRDELIAGLRALADFYENNPTMPLPVYPEFSVSCSLGTPDAAAVARVEHAAKLLGAEVTRSGGHTRTKRRFGAVEFKAYAVSKQSMAEHHAHMSYVGNVQLDGGAS